MQRLLAFGLLLAGCDALDVGSFVGPGPRRAPDLGARPDLASEPDAVDLAVPTDLARVRDLSIGPDLDPWFGAQCPGWAVMPSQLHLANGVSPVQMRLQNLGPTFGRITDVSLSGLDAEFFGVNAPRLPIAVPSHAWVGIDVFYWWGAQGLRVTSLDITATGCKVPISIPVSAE